MNFRLYLQTLRWNRVRLIAIVLASVGWGMLIPVIYVAFADAFKELANSGAFPRELMNFGSGSLFTLPGALTLGLQHPIAIAFVAIFAVGSTVGAIAGEREGGTLEVLLSRPISRLRLYVTVAAALATLLAIVMLALLGGQLLGVAIQGVGDEIDLGQMPLVFLNGLMLWAAFAAFGLAASVTFDRHAPALGLTMAYLLINYFLEILGSLWRDVSWSQEYSLFHRFNPGDILTGKADPLDFAVLTIAIIVPVAYALVVFPRRDLAAPS
jgi:ABC-2 type transport system permease protein